jgi:hypothetical protein
MMGYIPGHDCFVAFKPETGTSVSAYGFTTTLPAAPSNPTLVGYTQPPESSDDFGSKKGFAAGSRTALYNIDGAVVHELSIELRIADFAFLESCLAGSGGLYGGPNDLAIYVGVDNRNGRGYTDVYRYCKCSQLVLDFKEGGGQELTATATFWALAKEEGTAMSLSAGSLSGLGSPLFWHDVRTFQIGANDYRSALTGLSITLNHNLERKGIRPHSGYSDPLSLCPYELMPHHTEVSGELSLHHRLPVDLYTNALGKRRWGNLVISCSDSPRLLSGAHEKTFVVSLLDVMPQSRKQNRVESSAEVQYSVPIVATDLIVSGEVDAGGGGG